jgi:two-component system nitrogen regulation response regulator NtrX
VLLDVWLQGSRSTGLSCSTRSSARPFDPGALMISGHGNIDTAVAAIRKGAVDFIEKPFEADRLLHLVAARPRPNGCGAKIRR